MLADVHCPPHGVVAAGDVADHGGQVGLHRGRGQLGAVDPQFAADDCGAADRLGLADG